jgi:radical SAM protein with 4Fe4S-binding SPASM domain
MVIDTMGRLYSCPTFVGRDGFEIGSIYKESFNVLAEEFVKQETLPDCLHCAYFPVCGSGCRYGAQVKLGDWRYVLCEKENLAVNTAEMVKLRAERIFEGGSRRRSYGES